MIEKSLDPYHTNEPNDILAIKSHYIKTFIDNIFEKNTDDVEKTCTDWSKKYVDKIFTNAYVNHFTFI